MKTWHFEATVVGLVLAAVAFATTNDLAAWLSGAAVLASFMHAQIADRLAEREAARERPQVPCYRKARLFFLAKELLWCAFFVSTGSWPALAGVGVFLLYPAWRALWRRFHPLSV